MHTRVDTAEIQLFICRSPLQLLNCIEANEALDRRARRSVLLAGHVSARDEAMMSRLLTHYDGFSQVSLFPLYPLKNQKAALRPLLGEAPAVARLIVGDTTQYLNRLLNRRLKPESVVMVDDGASTLSRAPLIAARSLHRYRKNLAPQAPVVSWIKHGLALDPRFLYKAKFFSMYDLSGFGLAERTIRNEFAWLSARLADKPVGSATWFIGSNFAGDLLAHGEDYPKLITQLAEREDMRTLEYIPHRKESDELLQSLSQAHGFRLRRFENMLEIALLEEVDALPARIVSFGSSAVNTLHRLIRRPTTLYRLPPKLISAPRRAVVDGFFLEADANGFEIRPLSRSSEQE